MTRTKPWPRLANLPLAAWAMGLVAVVLVLFFVLAATGYNWLNSYWASLPYGFIDKTGTLRISVNNGLGPSFPYIVASKFCCGQCIVKNDSTDNFNFINKDGHLLFNQAIYMETTDFSEDLAGVKIDPFFETDFRHVSKPKSRQLVKWHFIDHLGHLAFDGQYDSVKAFSEGLCAVRKTGSTGWNYINKNGQIAFDGSFDDASAFSQERASVCKSGKWGVIDKFGKWIVKPCFTQKISPFSKDTGLAAVDLPETSERLYLNKDGQVALKLSGFNFNKQLKNAQIADGSFVIDPGESSFAVSASNSLPAEGLIPFMRDNLYGYCNLEGQEVIKPQFDYCWPFSQKLALVFDDRQGKFGYIDHTGKSVTGFKFKAANSFSDGFACVSDSDVQCEYFIDSTGANVFHRSFPEAAPFQEGYAYVGKKFYVNDL